MLGQTTSSGNSIIYSQFHRVPCILKPGHYISSGTVPDTSSSFTGTSGMDCLARSWPKFCKYFYHIEDCNSKIFSSGSLRPWRLEKNRYFPSCSPHYNIKLLLSPYTHSLTIIFLCPKAHCGTYISLHVGLSQVKREKTWQREKR